MIITIGSIKNSPGATTLAVALAASAPGDEPVLLVDADPAGGDIGIRFGIKSVPGIATLTAAIRRNNDPKTIWTHTQQISDSLYILPGLPGIEQATVIEEMLPTVLNAICCLQATVIVDAGRLLPSFANGALLNLSPLLIACRPVAEELIHLRAILSTAKKLNFSFNNNIDNNLTGNQEDTSCNQTTSPGIGVVMIGKRPYSSNAISKVVEQKILGYLPWDPKAANILSGQEPMSEALPRSSYIKETFKLWQQISSLSSYAQISGQHSHSSRCANLPLAPSALASQSHNNIGEL